MRAEWGVPVVVDPDPYSRLARMHKMPYSYSFETDFQGDQFLVRHRPRNMFFNFADPQYIPTNNELWRGGEEYTIFDELPHNSIPTKYSIVDVARDKNKNQYINFDWVSTRISAESSLKRRLESYLRAATEVGISVEQFASQRAERLNGDPGDPFFLDKRRRLSIAE